MPARRILTGALAFRLAVSFAVPSGALPLSDNRFNYTEVLFSISAATSDVGECDRISLETSRQENA